MRYYVPPFSGLFVLQSNQSFRTEGRSVLGHSRELRNFSSAPCVSISRSFVWAWVAAVLLLVSALPAHASTTISLSPTSLTFGTQLKGTTSAAKVVTITNTGTTSVSLTAIRPSNGFAQTTTCKASLAVGANCTVSVTFTPQANGTVSGTLSITDNATGSPQVVTLSGQGTIASLTPPTVGFGNQNVGSKSAPQTITLSNVGSSSIRVTAVTITGANASDFAQTNTCTSVGAGGSCTITVTFTPAAAGSRSGSVNVTLSSAVSPVPATLSGTGITSSSVTLSPSSVTFPSQSLHVTSVPQNVTLTNASGAVLNITSISISGSNPADFSQTNTCGSSVAVGGTCTISVVFQPTATGSRSGSLLVTDNASGSPQTVPLSGTVPNPVPLLQQPLVPGVATPGSAAPTITLSGAGFGPGASVLWNGSSRTTTFVSTTQVKATLQTSDLAAAGTGQVVVKNPTPAGGSSNPQSFLVATPTSTIAMSGSTPAVGTNPRGIALADFNGDGKLDIAVANRNANTVSILTGNGSGTFTLLSSPAVGTDPCAVAVGDFNGDGKLDIVTANRASYTISVLLGNGDGTFQAHTDYPGGTEPIALTAADVNGDGFLDIISLNSADNTISVYLGVGDGTFQPGVPYPTGSSPIGVVAGDFNGDGIIDVATVNSGTSNIAVLFGNGDGTFQPAAFYNTGSDPDGLVAVDLNGDGKLDFVAANNGSNTISVLLNNGNGTFGTGVTYAVGALPFSVAAGDFYDNGKVDIAVTNFGDNTVTLLPGKGDGTFNVATALTFSTGDSPIGLAAGDFNGDGRLDLVASNSVDDTISILLQTPSTSLSTTSLSFGSQSVGTNSAPQNVSLKNTGSAALTISSIAITGTNSNQYTQTNTCPASLTGGSSCTISVTFSPTTGGTMTANLSITDNAAGSPQLVSLLGTGVTSGVTLTPGSLTFASQTIGTTSAAQPVTLTNMGTTALTITSITASANFGQTNNCGSSVAAGAACTINVTFTPTATGTVTGTLSISDNVAGSPQTVSLTGTGASAPGLSLSPTSLTFASQGLDTTSAAKTVTLTNTGSGPLTITSIATTGSYAQTNTCGSSVAAGANCTISVTFTPTATGTNSGTVVVTDNASNSPQSVTLTGTGTTSTVAFAPTSANFGNITVGNKSAAKAIKLTNSTGAALTITKVAVSSSYSQTNTCGTSVANGANCTISVSFTPGTTGVIPGTLTITDSATNSPQTVPLTGTGIASGISFSPPSVTFANTIVGTSSAVSVIVVTNTGSASLTVTSATLTGANSGDFTLTNTCTTVSPGAICQINVTFRPTVTGTRTASVSVVDNAAGSPQSVPLTGTGIAATVTLSPASLNFGNVNVGSSSAVQKFTLSNAGNATLTITGITVTGLDPGDFSQTNTCGSSLAVATSCTISVTFTPVAAGTRSGSVSVSDNASGSPQTASLTGSGIASSVSFSTSSVTFPNTAIGKSSPVSGVTLFNTGSGTLSISSITITGANAADFSQTNNCGTSQPKGASCTISVTFKPTAAGTRTGAVSVSDNATGSPQTVTLTGTGTSGGPVASISPTTLTFGSTNVLSTSSAQTITLTNSGTVALGISSIVASGDYSQTNNCGSSVAAGAKCSVQVTFTPSATGSRTGFVNFADTDPSTIQAVTLNGTGAQPSSTVTISPKQASATPGQTAQFQASISGVQSSAVTWAVDGVNGGNSTTGIITSAGQYTAPSAAGSHIVTATSTANTTQSASVPMVVTAYPGVFVYHNDDGRTGQDLNETVLTTGNVNVNQFGKIFSYPVDGQMYAEPLYVMGVNVPGQGTHNVVYVVTENDTAYAFDADGIGSSPLWQVSFLTNGAQTLSTSDIGGCNNITPQVGITSTPVIDPQTNIIYILARTKVVTSGVAAFFQTLHALDITTGQETPGSPVVIQGTVNSSNGPVTFNPETNNQRAGLFLDNGVVYISWASHCDIQPYHGWIMGYDESTLQQVAVFNATPNGVEGGIWQSGAAPAVDEFGNIFVAIGNGTTDVDQDGVDYSEGLLNLSLSGGTLGVNDYFVPSNFQSLNSSDLDLGSGGPLLLPTQPTPPTDLLVTFGKQGMVYLMDRTNLGKYSPLGNQVIQTLPAGTVPTAHSMPAYWQNNIYFCGVTDFLKSFLLSNGLLSTSPTSESTTQYGYPGATPAISANGNANGIVWALNTITGDFAQLHAYDATNLTRELYNTGQNTTRDKPGEMVKFTVPTIANGKVYVGTQTELDVYGLLP